MSIPHPFHPITLDADARTFILLCFSKFLSAKIGRFKLIFTLGATESGKRLLTVLLYLKAYLFLFLKNLVPLCE